jgi:hypothetical protein
MSSAEPDGATLEAVFRTIHAHLEQSKDPLTKQVRFTVDHGDSTVFTNAHLARWFWRAVDVVTLFHERHPVAQVRVAGFYEVKVTRLLFLRGFPSASAMTGPHWMIERA